MNDATTEKKADPFEGLPDYFRKFAGDTCKTKSGNRISLADPIRRGNEVFVTNGYILLRVACTPAEVGRLNLDDIHGDDPRQCVLKAYDGFLASTLTGGDEWSNLPGWPPLKPGQAVEECPCCEAMTLPNSEPVQVAPGFHIQGWVAGVLQPHVKSLCVKHGDPESPAWFVISDTIDGFVKSCEYVPAASVEVEDESR